MPIKNKGKWKRCPNKLKLQIISEYIHSDASYKELSDKYNIRPGTIAQWMMKIRHGNFGFIEPVQGLRGRKSLKELDYKERYEILKKFLTFLVARRERK